MEFNFRKYCKSIVLRWLLPRLLSKKCCNKVPRSGKKAKMVNCYAIYVANKDGEFLHLISEINTEKKELHVNSLNPDDKTFSVPKTLPLSNILREQINVDHYYKESHIHYKSICDLFFKYVTKYDVAKINCLLLWEYFSQSRFNKKILINKYSIDILNIFYNIQLDQYDNQPYSSFTSLATGISRFDLMSKIHSPRWIEHPNAERQKHKLEMHLESLVHSGDLKIDDKGDRYILTGKALKTIEEYEKEERRHQDSLKVQRKLGWLTAIIASPVLVQAFKWMYEYKGFITNACKTFVMLVFDYGVKLLSYMNICVLIYQNSILNHFMPVEKSPKPTLSLRIPRHTQRVNMGIPPACQLDTSKN